MKNFTIIFLLFTLSQAAFGQSKAIQPDELLFEKGAELQQLVNDDLHLDKTIESKYSLKSQVAYATELRNTILQKSLGYYEEILAKFPHSKFVYRTLSNKAYIELTLGDEEEAIKDFSTILQGTDADHERGGRGTGIMAEPYANYKNSAAKNLAEIALKAGDYTKALAYLNLTKKYPYQHFCGNAYAADEIYLGEMYEKCYLGLNEYTKAYAAALPNLLENGLADNKNLVIMTYNALLKTYSKQELKSKFEQAIQKHEIIISKSGKYEYRNYFITFLEFKVPLNFWALQTTADMLKPEDISKLITKECLQSRFYALLTE